MKIKKRVWRYQVLFLFLVLNASLLNAKRFDANYDTTVATFGKFKISLSEFRIAYLDLLKRPNVFDSKELRENFLNELIGTRLIANEAKKINLNNDTLFNYKVTAYKNKCMRQAHYDAVIKPQINVAEKEIEDAYLYTQEERRLSHLFFKTKEEADSAYCQLLRGAKFEEIARNVFSDTLLKNNGGDLGWVEWERLDYDLADAAFKLLPDVFSKPVKSQYGYHILKVTDFKKKPLITRYEYEIQKKKTKYLVEFKKGEQLSFEYLNGLLKKAEITLYPKALQFVEKALAKQFKRRPDMKDAVQEFQISEEEMNKVETSLWDYRNEPIAVVNGCNFTLGEFLGNLSYIPYEVIYSNFDKTLDYSLRDFILNKEAGALCLQNDAKVIEKTNLYSEYYLRLGLSRKLVSGITVNDDEIKKYYQDHRASFKQAPYDTCASVIKIILAKEKSGSVIPDFIKTISKGITFIKNTDIINKYYDAVYKNDNR